MIPQIYASIGNGKRIAYLSTYPPRECGIATFTKDLIDSMDELGGFKSSVIAIDNEGEINDYDERVRCSIERNVLESYYNAAEYVNASNIDLINIQHEFGLFGGDQGEYIVKFLKKVRKPVVTTLHTVRPDFDAKALKVLKSIANKSAAVVVIANAAIKMLDQQGIQYRNCVVIPHGCPNIEFVDNKPIKQSLGLDNRLVASTFGLISRGKGIEYAIRALPYVIKNAPDLIYLIIGQTHPEVRKREGETYRNSLMQLVRELGLEKYVRFNNHFLTKRELIRYLQATDIYLTPYISPNQISSGALTYALGAGKAVVSTPYFHAQETINENRGILCKFNDPISIAEGINRLLDSKFRKDLQRRVYRYSRRFLWSNVARTYGELFNAVISNHRCFELGTPTCKIRLPQSSY